MHAAHTLLSDHRLGELAPLLPGRLPRRDSDGQPALRGSGAVGGAHRAALARFAAAPGLLAPRVRALTSRAGAKPACGRVKNGPQALALARSRGGFCSKRHLAGDAAGYPLGFALTQGQAGDAPPAAALLTPHLAPGRQVIADTAYDSDALRAQMATAGAVAVIPPKPNRREPPPLDRTAYRDRNQAERLINRLKQHRRIATRYDKCADSYRAFVYATASLLWRK